LRKKDASIEKAHHEGKKELREKQKIERYGRPHDVKNRRGKSKSGGEASAN